MGYTHYFHIDYAAVSDPTSFGRWALDVQKIIAAGRERGIEIGGIDKWGPKGEWLAGPEPGTEEFTEGYVLFNGVGDDSHETFCVEFKPSADARWFCKTERKPYDAVVGAAILRLKHYLGDAVDIGSDGRRSDKRPVAARARHLRRRVR